MFARQIKQLVAQVEYELSVHIDPICSLTIVQNEKTDSSKTEMESIDDLVVWHISHLCGSFPWMSDDSTFGSDQASARTQAIV